MGLCDHVQFSSICPHLLNYQLIVDSLRSQDSCGVMLVSAGVVSISAVIAQGRKKQTASLVEHTRVTS